MPTLPLPAPLPRHPLLLVPMVMGRPGHPHSSTTPMSLQSLSKVRVFSYSIAALRSALKLTASTRSCAWGAGSKQLNAYNEAFCCWKETRLCRNTLPGKQLVGPEPNTSYTVADCFTCWAPDHFPPGLQPFSTSVPSFDWHFSEFSGPLAFTLHCTLVEILSLPQPGPSVAKELLETVYNK